VWHEVFTLRDETLMNGRQGFLLQDKGTKALLAKPAVAHFAAHFSVHENENGPSHEAGAIARGSSSAR
jgi:hypothetical protein